MKQGKVSAGIYVRISRDIEGAGLGVERQLNDCKKLAKHLGLNVTEIFEDNDISAYTGKRRPGYERLLEAIRARSINAVICWHQDRLHRQTRELEAYIDICQPQGVPTHVVTASDLDLSSPSGRATAKTIGAWAQYESEHKSDRIRAQKRQAAASGKYLGGRIPWGWAKPNDLVEIDPVAAKFIRQGTQAIIDGESLVGVTRRWAQDGALSLSGTRMNTTQVRRILMRSRNAGITTFNGEPVAANWPPIITVEEFRAVEARLTDPTRPTQSESKFRYLLSGIIKCWCGRSMNGFGSSPTPEHPTYHRSYRCSVHQEGAAYVRGHAIRRMKPIDEHLISVVTGYLARDDIKEQLIQGMAAHNNRTGPQERSNVKDLVGRQAALARMFADGQIDEPALVEGTASIRDQIDKLTATAVTLGRSKALGDVLSAENPAAAFKAAPTLAKREVIRELFTISLKDGPNKHSGFRPELIVIKQRDY